MKALHYVQIALGCLVAASLALAHSLPQYAASLNAVAAVAAAVQVPLGLTTPAVGGSDDSGGGGAAS